MAIAMNAQDFHGVSIGGTVEAPTIVNSSDKPAIGYAVERITSNGINHLFTRISLENIALGTQLMPGTERPIAQTILGITKSVIDHTTGKFTDEGTPLSYELRAVLFADGTYVGMDSLFDEFSGIVSRIRSLARDIQYLADKYAVLEQERGSYDAWVKSPHKASVDVAMLRDRSDMAVVLLGIKYFYGEGGADVALAWIAALPEVTKGGN